MSVKRWQNLSAVDTITVLVQIRHLILPRYRSLPSLEILSVQPGIFLAIIRSLRIPVVVDLVAVDWILRRQDLAWLLGLQMNHFMWT